MKASGIDNIRPEIIKYILEEGINLLPKILKIAWSTKRSEKIRQDLKVKSVHSECRKIRQ